MPGWHEKTQQLQDSGEIQMVGIVQEQHPARARLFMQWQGMDWPVMVDSLNLLAVKVVPITLLIDEQGIVRFKGTEENLETFLKAKSPAPAKKPVTFRSRPNLDHLQNDEMLASQLADEHAAVSPDSWRFYGDGIVLWAKAAVLDRAIEIYRRALQTEPDHGPTHFRLGVAYRMRYDSEHRRQDDFGQAVKHWGAALDADPNQYIWRRRIQQYGPRLAKPYPFYDWVETARQEITARGETPVDLPVDPWGAEIAQPAKHFAADTGERTSPDPKGRIRRDDKGMVRIEQTAVPSTIQPGATTRLHLVFRPATDIEGHWNNEAGDLQVWIDPPAGWRVDRRHLSLPNPPELVSDEARRLEVEVESPASFSGTAKLPGYALYYVCEDVKGTCLYRRQDLEFEVRAAE